MTKYWRPETLSILPPARPVYHAPEPAAPMPMDATDPDTTVYWDQSVGSQEPGAGGPVVAWRVYYDNSLSGLMANNVQDAIDLLDNQLDAITGAGSGTEGRLTVLEAEMDVVQADIIALQSAGTSLAGRVTTAEANIVNLQADTAALDSRLDTAEVSIVALQASDVVLDDRLDTAEASITNLQGRMTAAEGDIDALQATDATHTAELIALDGRLDAVEASVAGPASEATAGIAELATTAEVTAGADDARIVTPLKLAQRLAALPAVPAASEAVAGVAEIATTAEVTAGADDARIVTPLKLAQRIAALPASLSLASQAEVNAGVVNSKAIAPDTLRGFNGWITGPLGIGGAPAVALHVKSTAATSLRVEAAGVGTALVEAYAPGASAAAMFGLSTGAKTFILQNLNSVFSVNDAVTVRLSINALGETVIGSGAAQAGYVLAVRAAQALCVIETTNPGGVAQLLWRNNLNDWGLQSAGADFAMYRTGALRMYFAESGYVGVGIVPSAQLHVYRPGYAQISVESTAGGQAAIYMATPTRAWSLNNMPSGEFWLFDNTASLSRLRITTTGNIIADGPLYVYDTNFGLFRGGAGGAPGDDRYFHAFPGNFLAWAGADSTWRFYTSSAEKFRVSNTDGVHVVGSRIADGAGRLTVTNYTMATRPAAGSCYPGTLIYCYDCPSGGPLLIAHGGQWYPFQVVGPV